MRVVPPLFALSQTIRGECTAARRRDGTENMIRSIAIRSPAIGVTEHVVRAKLKIGIA